MGRIKGKKQKGLVIDQVMKVLDKEKVMMDSYELDKFVKFSRPSILNSCNNAVNLGKLVRKNIKYVGRKNRILFGSCKFYTKEVIEIYDGDLEMPLVNQTLIQAHKAFALVHNSRVEHV